MKNRSRLSVYNKIIAALIIFAFLNACNNKKEKTIVKFSKTKPYAIEIAKERSYYQAEKILNRLLKLDVNAYIVQSEDTIDDQGKWYYILCETSDNLDSAKVKRTKLENNLKISDLKIANYNNFHEASFKIDSIKQKEAKKIPATKPGVPLDVYKVLHKFPESNVLYIQEMFIVNSPKNIENKKGYSSVYSFPMDLPRGISKKLMLEKTTAYAEVIYKDNLYGDKVTIDIGKLRQNVPNIVNTSIINTSNKKNFEIAEEYADLVLNTGEYLFEEKKEIKVNSFTTLYGYKVTIEPKKDYFRTYLILVDESTDYILFSQSTDKSMDELLQILENVGKGSGLLNYDEFYNTFFTIPGNLVDNDRFIGFKIDKLTWSYAKQKGYAKWAKEMVGHWNANGFFYNTEKGLWTYNIFDLLITEEQEYIYGGLYTKDRDGKNKVNVYNTEGFAIYKTVVNWSTWSSYKKLTEINFGVGRYICSIDNTEHSWLNKEEMIRRAEALQFKEKEGKPEV